MGARAMNLADILNQASPNLWFCAKTGLCAALLVLLDCLVVQAGRDSYLQITHGFKGTPTNISVWFIGAAIVAWVGTLISFYQETPQSIVLIALTWPVFLKQVAGFLQRKQEDEQP